MIYIMLFDYIISIGLIQIALIVFYYYPNYFYVYYLMVFILLSSHFHDDLPLLCNVTHYAVKLVCKAENEKLVH